MGLWDDFMGSDAMLPTFGAAAGGALGAPFGAGLPGAAIGASIGSWAQEYLTEPGGMVAPPSRTPEQQELIRAREESLKGMLETLPTAEERFEVARGDLAGQASRANQLMVSNAARRGLLHSGILAAEKSRLQRGLTEGATQARIAAERGESTDRAAILRSIAQGKPLPEVTVMEQDTTSGPMVGGLLGAGVGALATQSPEGALSGYQLGRAIGSGTGREEPSRRARAVQPRWEEV